MKKDSWLHRVLGMTGFVLKSEPLRHSATRKKFDGSISSTDIQRSFEQEARFRPKPEPWRYRLDEILIANENRLPSEQRTLASIYREMKTLGYDGSYDAVRRFVKIRSKARLSVLPQTKMRGGGDRLQSERGISEWAYRIGAGQISLSQIEKDIGKWDDIRDLLAIAKNGKRIHRNRALAILVSRQGVSGRAASRILGIDRKSFKKYVHSYAQDGFSGLLYRKVQNNRKIDSEPLREAIFSLLHEPPSTYDVNRTSWKMADFKKVLAQNGHLACPDVIRTITKKAGYRWRQARIVLTSNDPDYREKLDKIQLILSKLGPDEGFFSIDEFGPFAVKKKAGRSLVGPNEMPTVPQWQKSKGCLILTAALELSSNQVAHFYSTKKNTDEMIKLMDILVEKYPNFRNLYLSWDAASWHISKKLTQHIEDHNLKYRSGGRPKVKTAPLPACAQFLNVIESIFSGMARAIIHNSDYQSVDDAKAAIDRYFSERNRKFLENPECAGNKIWGEERELSLFSAANNCKDPRYR